MSIFNLSPEKYPSAELAPELAERMSEVQQSVQRLEQAVRNTYPGEFSQDISTADYAGETANAATNAPHIQGIGYSELTPDNVTNIRTAIDRYASPSDFLQRGIRHDTEEAA